ncbi:P-loop NTPase fold protein [Actinophytocola sp. KF-1]
MNEAEEAVLVAAADGYGVMEFAGVLRSVVGGEPRVRRDGVALTVTLTNSLFGLPGAIARALPDSTKARVVVHRTEGTAMDLLGSQDLRGDLSGTYDRTVAAFFTDEVVDLLGEEPPARFRRTTIETRFADVGGFVLVIGVAPSARANGIVSLSVAGDRAAVGHTNGLVEVWDLGTGDQARGFRSARHPVVGMFPDGHVITVDDRGGAIWRDAHDRRGIGTRAASPSALVVHPDGVRFALGYAEGHVELWSATDGRADKHMRLAESPVSALAATDEWLFAVHDGVIWRTDWAGQGGRPLHGPGDPAQVLATGPNVLLSGGPDGAVRTWDMGTGMRLASFETGAEVVALTTTPDGHQVVTGHPDGTLRRWDARGNPVGTTISAHGGPVTGLATTVDGRVLVSTGDDGELRRWYADSGAEVVGAVTLPERLAEVVSDVESAEDRLGVGVDVQVLAAVLAALSTTPPLSIALLGDWGAGKSSFMRQLRERVSELAGRAARTEGRHAFAATVRQVTFNAWHYSDDHLWVGIVEHLFRELRDQPAAAADTTEVSQLEARLESEGAERDRLERDLDAVRRVDARRGWFLAPVRSWAVFRATVTGAWRELWSGGWRLWLGLAVLAGGIGVAVLGQQLIGIVAGVLGPAIAVWSQVRHYVDTARERLLARKAELDDDIRATADKLDELDPARRLDRLLTEITAEDRYATFRGLTGRIHHDLRRLSTDLATARARWDGDGAPPLQRIVLYVDDLDRCTPARVVDVLQAVNLLLTMDLFMVVVAVDPRWLLRSLDAHHGGLFGPDTGPVAYLDKIFHIPFALRPMGNHAVAFLHSLLPDAEPEPVAAPPADWALTTPAAESGPGTSAPSRPVPAPVVAPVRTAPVVTAEGLRITAAEREFLGRLTPLLTTPRAIKKLTNLYRLLRLSVPRDALAAFLDGPYQAAALLLTALAGAPHEARALLTHLAASSADDVTDALKAAGSPLATRLADLVGAIGADMPVHTDAATYRRWAGEVARFGFETYDLYPGG